MANYLQFLFIFVIIYSILSSTESQEIYRKRDDLSQQIHVKVERINLKDFGFERQTPVEREAEQRVDGRQRLSIAPKVAVNRDRRPDFAYSGRRNPRDESRRSYSRSADKQEIQRSTEREIPSAIDWSLSPKRTGVVIDGDMPSKRAYNFSKDSDSDQRFASEPLSASKPLKDCSQVCVDRKYLQHYYTKGCTQVTDHECKCAVGFDCPSSASTNSTVCQYDQRIYQIGSRIPVRNPCRICECRDFGRRRGQVLAEIDCGIGIECPEGAFGLKPEPNCYFAYERDDCCGHQVCTNTLQPKREQKVCKYRGKEYRRGEKIYPEEDHCKSCLCSDDWSDANPLASPACHTYRCDFELDKDFKSGCLPIYHESSCCPIEYKCPKNFLLSTQTPDSTQCVFDGRKYPIGWRLATENVCVDCVCRAPPDFTCVQKSCPTPPHNCYVGKWDTSVCCQHYVCNQHQHQHQSQS